MGMYVYILLGIMLCYVLLTSSTMGMFIFLVKYMLCISTMHIDIYIYIYICKRCELCCELHPNVQYKI